MVKATTVIVIVNGSVRGALKALMVAIMKHFGRHSVSQLLPNSWTFHDDGTWEAELILEGEAAVKSMGTYSLSGSDYTATGLSEALEDTEADSAHGLDKEILSQ